MAGLNLNVANMPTLVNAELFLSELCGELEGCFLGEKLP